MTYNPFRIVLGEVTQIVRYMNSGYKKIGIGGGLYNLDTDADIAELKGPPIHSMSSLKNEAAVPTKFILPTVSGAADDEMISKNTAQSIVGVKTFSANPVISAITNTGTLTLPTSAQTLIGTGGSSVMTAAVENAVGKTHIDFSSDLNRLDHIGMATAGASGFGIYSVGKDMRLYAFPAAQKTLAMVNNNMVMETTTEIAGGSYGDIMYFRRVPATTPVDNDKVKQYLISQYHAATNDDGKLAFRGVTQNGTYSYPITLYGGKVGIGYMSPSESLHVVGNIRLSGTLTNGVQVFTLPAATGTLATLAATETLTNKSLGNTCDYQHGYHLEDMGASTLYDFHNTADRKNTIISIWNATAGLPLTITAPAEERIYVVRNHTTEFINNSQGVATNWVIPPYEVSSAACDGSDYHRIGTHHCNQCEYNAALQLIPITTITALQFPNNFSSSGTGIWPKTVTNTTFTCTKAGSWNITAGITAESDNFSFYSHIEMRHWNSGTSLWEYANHSPNFESCTIEGGWWLGHTASWTREFVKGDEVRVLVYSSAAKNFGKVTTADPLLYNAIQIQFTYVGWV